ncbi:MAG: hypothetical protein AAFQ51_02310 [Pseudomonadota bacterium]
MTDLDALIIAAHDRGDGAELVSLYARAADDAAEMGDMEASFFYLTHAMVFALEEGDPREAALRARLTAAGREAPVPPARPSEST